MAINEGATPLQHEEMIGRRVALISSTVGMLLAVTKIVVGLQAHATSVVSDGLEAAGDVLSSAVVYAGLWLASRPPDAEHPYGHGRYETLAGLGVGAILLLTGAGILWHGLTSPEGATHIPVFAIYPLLAAIAIKVVLATVKLRIAKRINSSALQADAWHDVTDLVSTMIALLAVLLTLSDPIRFVLADRLGSIIIAVIVLALSLQVVRRTTRSLLDTMPEAAKLLEIKTVALSVPGARGIEKCLARRTGMRYHVDLHLEVDPDMTVRASHSIATEVKHVIKERLAWVADVLVHVEPSEHGDSEQAQAKRGEKTYLGFGS